MRDNKAIVAALTRILFAACLATLSQTGSSQSYYSNPGQSGGQHPFVESMQIMMDAMGINRQGGAPGSSFSWPQGSPGQSFSTLPGSMPGTMSPWFGNSIPGQSQMQQMMRRMPQPGRQDWTDMGSWSRSLQQFATPGSELQGTWYGRGGEVLFIQGDRYRIYASANRYTDGQLVVQGNVLRLSNPKTGTAQEYEFASHEGRLVLRDPWGQLLLFRRTE